MSEVDIDPLDVDTDIAEAELAVADSVPADGTVDVSAPPDPLTTVDVAPLFGGEVLFEDGTAIENPRQDALGYLYQIEDDWINGVGRNIVESGGSATTTT
ncbi:MAG: hypothetical protein ACT4O0_10805 [Pseudonocardia sp.]